jgi:hypothetical protein
MEYIIFSSQSNHTLAVSIYSILMYFGLILPALIKHLTLTHL